MIPFLPSGSDAETLESTFRKLTKEKREQVSPCGRQTDHRQEDRLPRAHTSQRCEEWPLCQCLLCRVVQAEQDRRQERGGGGGGCGRVTPSQLEQAQRWGENSRQLFTIKKESRGGMKWSECWLLAVRPRLSPAPLTPLPPAPFSTGRSKGEEIYFDSPANSSHIRYPRSRYWPGSGNAWCPRCSRSTRAGRNSTWRTSMFFFLYYFIHHLIKSCNQNYYLSVACLISINIHRFVWASALITL